MPPPTLRSDFEICNRTSGIIVQPLLDHVAMARILRRIEQQAVLTLPVWTLVSCHSQNSTLVTSLSA